MSEIAVVGAGVLGSAIAWRLAQAGHAVTLVDPAPGGQASPGSFAWLNASFAEDAVYNRLRHDSLELWEAMKASDPSVPVDFPGAILFEQDHFDLDAIETSQATLGRPHARLDGASVTAREPAVKAAPGDALLMGADGYGDPVEITRWFLDAALATGAELVTEAAQTIRVSGSRVSGVVTATREIVADHVVIAAGVDIGSMLSKLGLTFAMDNQPGLLAKTSAGAAQTGMMLATPGVHCWQRPDGGFLIGASFGGDTEAVNAAERKAASVLGALKQTIEGTETCEVEDITVRVRPMPADGRPAIGPLGPEGLYVVCTHSGMTLAPVIAEMVSSEIGGTTDPRLEPYRPDRAALRGDVA
ncbi:MAG: FAD-dependent oxidoreductase [Pseudomonadota bacterium]